VEVIKQIEKILKHEPNDERDMEATKGMGWFYVHFKKYEEAVKVFQRGLQAAKKTKNAKKEAAFMGYLGSCYRNMANYDDSIDMLEKSLSIQKGKYGRDNAEVAHTMNSLAMSYIDYRQADLAKDLLDEARDIYSKTLGPNHPQTITVLHNLGGLYMEEDPKQALKYLQEALKAKEKAYGSDNYSLVITLENLHDVYVNLKSPTNAQACAARAEKIKQQQKGFVPEDEDLKDALGLKPVSILIDDAHAQLKKGVYTGEAMFKDTSDKLGFTEVIATIVSGESSSPTSPASDRTYQSHQKDRCCCW